MNDKKRVLTATKRIDAWFDYFASNIKTAHEDVEFSLSQQWEPHIKAQRQREGKPCLQFNQLYAQVAAIIGEHRQNTPNIIVNAVSAEVDQAAVELRAGLIRQVFYESRSEVAFQEAFKWTMYGGFAVLRIDTRYASPDSFQQVIRLSALSDPTQAFFDPAAQCPDKSDGDYCGLYERLTPEQFKRRYPEAKLPVVTRTRLPSSTWAGWYGDNTVTVVDYFVKEYAQKTLVQLSDGILLDKSLALKRIADSQGALSILDERCVEDYTIQHYQLTADQIVAQSRWPSKKLPLVFVDGDSFYHQGQQVTKSFIHYAKDAQRYLNYIVSESALAILTRRKEEWLATPDNIKGYESQWSFPN